MKIPDQVKSRKLWLSLIAAAVAFGNAMWNWGLSQEEVWTIVMPLLAYIGVEGTRDAVEAWRKNGA